MRVIMEHGKTSIRPLQSCDPVLPVGQCTVMGRTSIKLQKKIQKRPVQAGVRPCTAFLTVHSKGQEGNKCPCQHSWQHRSASAAAKMVFTFQLLLLTSYRMYKGHSSKCLVPSWPLEWNVEKAVHGLTPACRITRSLHTMIRQHITKRVKASSSHCAFLAIRNCIIDMPEGIALCQPGLSKMQFLTARKT